jgi:HAD superfamily hydrolase (TIGR01490 family)
MASTTTRKSTTPAATTNAPAKKATPRTATAKSTQATKAAKKQPTRKKSASQPSSTSSTRKSAPRKPSVKATTARSSQSDDQVAQYSPTAAFFDLDRTLIRGSANFPLALAAFKAGFVPKRQLAKDVVNAVVFVVAGASDERSAKVRERILGAVAGVPVKDIVSLGDAFIPHLAQTVMPESQAELDRMKAEGRDRIIVSASPTEIVEALAKELGLEGAVGTRSEIKNGKYTGKLAGPFCYGKGKVEAIEALASERGYDLSKSVAYSDSISDLPFMNAVGSAVAINADRSLIDYAIDHGWRVVETREDTARVAEAALDVRRSTEELAAALASLALSRSSRAQGKISSRTAQVNERAEATIASAQEQLTKSASLIGGLVERLPGF